IDYTGLGHLLGNALLKDLGEPGVAGFQPCVLTDANHCCRSALRGCLLVEQNLNPAEDDLAGVQEWHLVRALEVLPLEVEVDPADHDLQVFRNLLLLLFRGSALQSCQHRLGFLPLLVFIDQSGLRNLGVELAQSLLRTRFGVVLEDNLDQPVGVTVADRDPSLVGSLGLREARRSQNRCSGNQHQLTNQDSLLRTNRISKSCWDEWYNPDAWHDPERA